jgi:hypothetical protein
MPGLSPGFLLVFVGNGIFLRHNESMNKHQNPEFTPGHEEGSQAEEEGAEITSNESPEKQNVFSFTTGQQVEKPEDLPVSEKQSPNRQIHLRLRQRSSKQTKNRPTGLQRNQKRNYQSFYSWKPTGDLLY